MTGDDNHDQDTSSDLNTATDAPGSASTVNGLDVTACKRCQGLVESRSQIVNGVGPADAELVFIGEAPGANEDEYGEPFVGRSGDVLDDALNEAGVSRDSIRITNCVRCRPPENRNPTTEELSNCRRYLEHELSALNPAVIVTLGKVPSEHLLDRQIAVTTAAGDVTDIRLGDQSYRVIISVHPAATLYDQSQSTTFVDTIKSAASLAGVQSDIDNPTDTTSGGQSRLGEYED
ncbi:uracil-DNA glycosylase [Haloquadratum walsbyi]|jgi:DNA polymerase|uniref:Type-4 uracil-DNA glycosylase n=1 Tax=Haloquadratum walsbyi (strain DSM 16854 / JCM 12705 / C23) TaxID=768065 RepID=G0LJW8_HALWC|nr:uracil-DNA glycosylase [Haloquadratum walsbyi]CCC39394.1 uracil-DNA glycosylase [Haloquadratum walsbyi C23]